MALTALSQADLLALFRRLTGATYSGPMVGQPVEAAIQGVAAEMARASSAAVTTLDVEGHILTASIGALATGSVTFTRSLTGSTATILAGTSLATPDGLLYVTTADASFGALSATASAAARAVYPSYQSNVPAARVTVLKAMLTPAGQVNGTVLGTVTVSNAAAFTGGKSPVLELHARNRGIFKQTTETEAEFRDRIRRILETQTIPNVLAAGNRALAPGGKQGALDEAFDLGPTNLSQTQAFCLDADFFDFQLHDEYLLNGETRGAFFFRVPLFTSTVPAGFVDGAYFFDTAGLDQQDAFVRGLYAACIRAVEFVKAAGVHAVFLVDPNL